MFSIQRRLTLLLMVAVTSLFAVSPALAQAQPTLSFFFGSGGSDPGEFWWPGSIAFDSEGDVWVASNHDNRIQQFNSEGEYINQFAVTGGSESAEVEVGPDDHIYVVDKLSAGVLEFDQDGDFVRQHFSGTYVKGITFASDGTVWLAAHNVVGHLESIEGEWRLLSTFNPDLYGGYTHFYDMALDSEGDIWIAQPDTHIVQEFSPYGSLLTELGGMGSGNGEFYQPTGLAIDSQDHVYVAEEYNNRVQEFDANGDYVDQFSTSEAEGDSFDCPFDIAFADGSLWISQGGIPDIQRWELAS